MKKRLFALTLCIFAFSLHAVEVPKPYDHTQIAESLGHLIVRHLANPGFELDINSVIKGIEDERDGIASPLSEEEYEQAIYAIQEELFTKVAEDNLVKANEFLEQNSVADGIEAIEDKLQYRVEHLGAGEVVEEQSMPLIHYKGSLLDGTVFANSQEDGGEPITLPINQTIPGFTKGLVGMKEGEKRTLYIHPDLAYGLSGQLPPNSLLIFEVEILKANETPMEEIASQGESIEETPR